MPVLQRIIAISLVAALAACSTLPPPARTGPRPSGAGGGQPSTIAKGSYTLPAH